MSNTRVDIEEIESTRSERFLAVVLTAFLLVGSIWFYVQVDDWIMGDEHSYVDPYHEGDEYKDPWDKVIPAQEALEDAQVEREQAKDALDLALAKGEDTAALEAAFTAADEAFDEARIAATLAEKQAQAEENRLQEKSAAEANKDRERNEHRAPIVAGVRLAFIALWLGVSFRLLSHLRRRQSRFLALGFSAVATGVITALVFATDYITDWIDPLDFGPLVLSAVGAAATIGAFIGLQRYLAKRIPGRRTRKGDCPFCGYPVREDAITAGRDHCEGCGRDVVASCNACAAPRRVGTPHCGSCGAV